MTPREKILTNGLNDIAEDDDGHRTVDGDGLRVMALSILKAADKIKDGPREGDKETLLRIERNFMVEIAHRKSNWKRWLIAKLKQEWGME